MTINTVILNHRTRYFIKNAGGGDICYFDTMETAGIVLRYLQGAEMPPEDSARAVEAMKEFDRGIAEQAAEREAQRQERRARALAVRARKQAAEQEGKPDVDPE